MSNPTNPYIAGNPITGSEMFFGRQDVFRFIRETLVGRYQDNAIVLYGGRRTGKTSVLYQMGRYLDDKYVPVFIDLQAISLDGLGEMLWGIARQAVRKLRQQRKIELSIPVRDEFANDPEGCFYEHFLDPALQALGDAHLLLMLDEAARLYEQVQAGQLEPRAFGLLRSLIQYHPRLNFIFCIGSALEEMRQEYALLFNLCQYRKISFLERDSAAALITRPVEEYYRYAPGTVERVLEATHGHPYYTQLVCNRLFARWVRHGGDEVTAADVDAVLSEAVEQGMASLQYTWEETSDAARQVLVALSALMEDGNRPVSFGNLRRTLAAQETPPSRRMIGRALQELVSREVLRSTRAGYMFTVDLMRLWVKEHQPTVPPARLDWVRLILVGVSAGLLFLMIGLSIIVGSNTKQGQIAQQAAATARGATEEAGHATETAVYEAIKTNEAVVTAMCGTIDAMNTRLAQAPTGDPTMAVLRTDVAVRETQVAGMANQFPPPETSTPSPTHTPTPTATPTPSPIPTPCLAGDGPFTDIWRAERRMLGCALGTSQEVKDMARETFEGGLMLWQGGTNQVIVLYGDSEWVLYDGTWKEGDPHVHPDCASMTPPSAELSVPVRGFGDLWCTNKPVRDRLGWATEEEQECSGVVQEFDRGQLMMVAREDTEEMFVFYCENETCYGGKWRQVEQETPIP
jgi:hypothetical protein